MEEEAPRARSFSKPSHSPSHYFNVFFVEKCNARMDTVQTTRGSAGGQEEENIERVVHKEKSKYLHS